MAEEKKVYQLQFPITTTIEGKETVITEVTVGRLKAKHLKLMPSSLVSGEGGGEGKVAIEPATMLPLIAALTDLPIEVIEEMDMEDLTCVVEGVGAFFGKSASPQTGENVSG